MTLTGGKPNDATLLINGVPTAGPGSGTSWSADVPLSAGRNTFTVDTRDHCMRTSGAAVNIEIVFDDTDPVVQIAAPTAGQQLGGTVTITGSATDDDAVASVALTVGGQPASMTGNAMFSLPWDSTTVADGPVTLTVTAVDRAGNSGSASVVAAVSNSVAAGPVLVSVEGAPSMNDPAQARSAWPAVAATADYRLVVWHDNADVASSGNDDDILLREYDATNTLRSSELVSSHADDGRSQYASIAPSSSSGAHIVWQEDGDLDGDRNAEWDVVYRSWSAGMLGASTVVVSTGAGDGSSRFPRVADRSGTAHIVWQDNGDLDGDGSTDNDIYYATGSTTFGGPVLLSNSMHDGVSSRPAIAVDAVDGCPHVVWIDTGSLVPADTDGGDWDLYYRGSAGAGCTWGATVLISTEPGFGGTYTPSIVADDDVSQQFWIAYEADGDVANSGTDLDVYLRSVFSGVPGPLILISDDANDANSRTGVVAVDSGGVVHVSWTEEGAVAGTGSDWDVFTRSWDGTALSAIERVSDTAANTNVENSLDPAMTTLGATRLWTWSDQDDFDGDGIADRDIVLLAR